MGNISDFIQFGVIFLISLLGALSNDYYNTITKEDDTRVEIAKVLLGALTSAIIMFAVGDYLIKVSYKSFVFLCYVSGIGGFNSFGWMKKINIIAIVCKYIKIEGITEHDDEENKEE